MLAFASSVLAQEAQDTGSDINLFVGSHLPNQIPGVTEILPVFGARYGLGTGLGKFEFGFMNTHAQGVDFTTLEASLRGEIPVGEGIVALIYGGADLNYYRPEGEFDRRSEVGLHIGAGALVHVAETFWLRGEFKLMGGPGVSLYMIAGIVFRAPELK